MRERREDIPSIVEDFQLRRRSKGRRIVEFTRDALVFLCQQKWAGNVRELLNILERSAVNAAGDYITSKFLMTQLDPSGDESHASFGGDHRLGDPIPLSEIEKRHIQSVLWNHGWNVSKAAVTLGIDVTTVRRKIKEYNIGRPKIQS